METGGPGRPYASDGPRPDGEGPSQSMSMAAWSARHRACAGAVAPLTAEEIAQGLRALDGWRVEEGRLVKRWQFSEFRHSVQFVNRIAAAAEELNHHPDLRVERKRTVAVLLWTNKKSALTVLDFECAEAIDALLRADPGDAQEGNADGK
jgi:4a-hydroxytetrahydrobiopterin dehydratase